MVVVGEWKKGWEEGREDSRLNRPSGEAVRVDDSSDGYHVDFHIAPSGLHIRYSLPEYSRSTMKSRAGRYIIIGWVRRRLLPSLHLIYAPRSRSSPPPKNENAGKSTIVVHMNYQVNKKKLDNPPTIVYLILQCDLTQSLSGPPRAKKKKAK